MKLLLVDDDRELVEMLAYVFRKEGFQVVSAFDGNMAVRVFEAEAPDVIILDMNMPKQGGKSVLQEIRRQSQAPIIVLTAQRDEEQIVDMLQMGADDYVLKPFLARELKARVGAVLRRSRGQASAPVTPPKPLTCGEIVLDPGSRQVTVAGRPVQLTPTEFALLQYLMLNRGVVSSPSRIVENVWGYESDQRDNVVKLTISRLRRKVESDPSNPRYIVNVPGQGYMMSATD
jgi:DNA-binding response OmpR family regulator